MWENHRKLRVRDFLSLLVKFDWINRKMEQIKMSDLHLAIESYIRNSTGTYNYSFVILHRLHNSLSFHAYDKNKFWSIEPIIADSEGAKSLRDKDPSIVTGRAKYRVEPG